MEEEKRWWDAFAGVGSDGVMKSKSSQTCHVFKFLEFSNHHVLCQYCRFFFWLQLSIDVNP